MQADIFTAKLQCSSGTKICIRSEPARSLTKRNSIIHMQQRIIVSSAEIESIYKVKRLGSPLKLLPLMYARQINEISIITRLALVDKSPKK